MTNEELTALRAQVETLTKQRDELLAALKWALGNINCEPFEWSCEEDVDAHTAAIASVKGETK